MPYLFIITFALVSSTAMGKLVSLQFVMVPNSAEKDPIELRTGEDQSVPIKVRPHKISEFHRVPPREHWSVGTFKQEEDGTRKFVEYGKVKALESQHQLVMLIRTGDKNKDGLKLVVVGNELVRFNGGTFLMVNGSDKTIAGTLDDQKLTIAPTESSLIQNIFVQNKRSFHVQFSYRREDKMKLFYSTKWPLNQKARGLVCFYNDSTSKRLKMHAIHDF